MNYNRNLFKQINRITNEVTGSYRSYTPPEPPVVTDTVTITTQPTDITCYIGDTATLSIVAVSDDETATLSYQWQILNEETWVNVSGATSSSYVVPTSGLKEDSYRCQVTSDKGGSATSTTATVTVSAQPLPPVDHITITTQPTASTSVYVSQTATLSVVAESDDPDATLYYLWQVYNSTSEDWDDIVGASSSTYTAPTSTVGVNTYRVQIASSLSGTATSNSATVTVSADTVSIITNPGDTQVYINEGASVACEAISNAQGAVLSYQWQEQLAGDWYDISGATSDTYSGIDTSQESIQVFRCIITSSYGGTATTTGAVVLVYQRDTITITSQPTTTSGYVGDTITLSVTAVSDNPNATLSYQWQVKDGATYDDISGATSSTYTVPTSTAGTERYRVVVSSDKGATDVTSNYADVTIRASDIVSFTVQPQSYEHTNTGIIATYNPLISTPCTAVSDDNSAVMDYEYQCYDQNSSEWVTISNTGSTCPLVLFTTSAEVQIMYYDGVDYSYSTQTQPASCRCVATSSLGGTAISNTYNVTNVNPPQPPDYYIRATSVAGTQARFYIDDPDYEITSVSAKMGGSTISPTIGTGGKYLTLPAVTRASGAKSYEITLNGEFTYNFSITYYGSATLTSNASSRLTKSSGSWAAQTTTFTATLTSSKDYYTWDGVTIGTSGSCTPSSYGSTTNTMTYTYTNTRTSSGFTIKGATTGHSGTSWTILTASLNIAP